MPVPIDWLALLSAWLTGLFGSAHCAAMCGGIAVGLGSTAPSCGLGAAVLTNIGRILGYALAGALVGAFGAALVVWARSDALVHALRLLAGLVFVVAALRLLDTRGRLRLLSAPGSALWQRLRPLLRYLLPADRWEKRLALGMLWGWLPCGLSATLLAVAVLQASALHGALIMLAFGAGTLATMLPLTWSGARLGHALQRPAWRRAAAGVVLLAGGVTLSAPWLMQAPQLHRLLAALGCVGPA